MTTPIDVITDALREISVLAQNETASAFQGQQGLNDLKKMIANWELDGIGIGDVSTWILTTDIPLPENHIHPIVYNLAVRECSRYGKTPKQATVALAMNGFRQLEAAYGGLIDMTIDPAIRPRWRLPSGRPL